MNEQLLKDLVATAQADNYNWDKVAGKFPELKEYDVQLLKDYVATAEKYNYNYDVINSKFPEFKTDEVEVDETIKTLEVEVDETIKTPEVEVKETVETPDVDLANVEIETGLGKIKPFVIPEKSKASEIRAIDFFNVPGKKYDKGEEGFAQSYLNQKYNEVDKQVVAPTYGAGGAINFAQDPRLNWFKTDEGRAWWEKNWYNSRNRYITEKAGLYEHPGEAGGGVINTADYYSGKLLGTVTDIQDQTSNAIAEDSQKENPQFAQYINMGIQEGVSRTEVEALNSEIRNLLIKDKSFTLKDFEALKSSQGSDLATSQFDLTLLPPGIVDQAKMNLALKNAEAASTYQEPLIAKAGFYNREIIRLSTNNSVLNPLNIGVIEENEAKIADYKEKINELRKEYFKDKDVKSGADTPNQWYDPLSGSMIKKSEASATQIEQEAKNRADAIAIWGDTNIETLYQQEDKLINELIYLANVANENYSNIEGGYDLNDEIYSAIGSYDEVKSKLEEQSKSKTLVPGLKYLRGNSLVEQKFNQKINEVLRIQKAIDLNFKPTDLKQTANYWDYMRVYNPFYTESKDEGSFDTDVAADNEAQEFINFTVQQVGKENAAEILGGDVEKIEKYWDPGLHKSGAASTAAGIQIAAEFMLTRKFLGKSVESVSKGIKGVGTAVAGEGRVAQGFANTFAAIGEEAYVIQGYNSFIAAPQGKEAFDLKFALGAGFAGSLLKGSNNILMNSQTYRNVITNINRSQLGTNLLKGTTQPVLGTFTVMSGQIVENALKDDITLGQAFDEAVGINEAGEYTFENMLNTLIMVASAKAANPVSAINRVYEAGMNDFRAWQGKINTAATKAAKVLDLESELTGEKEEVIEVDFQEGTSGTGKKTYKKKTLSEKQINSKATSLRNKEGLNKPDSELSTEQIKRKNEIKKAARDLKNQLLWNEANTFFKAKYGKNEYANIYTLGKTLMEGGEPTIDQKLTLANMPSLNQAYSIIKDPSGPFAKNKNFETKFVKYAQQYKTFVDYIRKTGAVANDVKKQKELIKSYDNYLKDIAEPLAAAEALKKKGDKSVELKEKISELQLKQQEWIEGIELDLKEYTTQERKSRREKFIKPLVERQGEIDYEVVTNEQFQKEFPGETFTEGLFVSSDGRIRVNEDYAKEINNVTVDSHELLHPVMDVTLNKLAAEGKLNPFIDQFKESLPKNIRDAVQKKIDERSDITDKEYTREWFTITSDVLSGGKIKVEDTKSIGQKLAKTFTDLFKSETPLKDVDFETGSDAFEFIKRYAKSVRTGKADKPLEEAVVSKLKRFKPTEGVQRSVTTPEGKPIEKIKDLDKLNWKKYKTKKEFQDSKEFASAYNFIYSPQMKLLIESNLRKDLKTEDNVYEAQAELTKLLMRFDPVEQFKLPADKQALGAYMGGKLLKFKIGTAANIGKKRGSGKTVSVDKTMGDGKTTFAETLETKDDIEGAIDKKSQPTKPVKEVATSVKVGMPKTIKEYGGEVDADTYIQSAAEKVNYKELPNITEPAGPNQTISPFLSKLKSKIATSRKYKEEVAQSMGKGKQRGEYLGSNFKNIVESVGAPYFAGLITRKINSGKEVLLPKNLIQKDVGEGYTSDWYGKKAKGVKAAKTGITSGLQRIRINPNFDFKNKANIEAFQNAFKTQGRYEGLAGQIAAKGVIDYVQKSLGTGNKLDAKIKQQYGTETKDLTQELKNQLAKANYQRSATNNLIDALKRQRLKPKEPLTKISKEFKLDKNNIEILNKFSSLTREQKRDILQFVGKVKRDLIKSKDIVEEFDRTPGERGEIEKQYTAWKKAYPEIGKKFGFKDIEYIAKPESALFEGDFKERSLKNLQSAADIFPSVKSLTAGGAKYLAQAIEAFLGIGNIKIDGQRLTREVIDNLLEGKGKGEVKEWMTRVFQPNWNTAGLKKQWKQVLKEANEKFDPKSQEFKDFIANNGRDILTHPDLRGTENGFELTQEANREAIKYLLKGLKERYRKNPTQKGLEDLARLLQLQTNHQKGILGGLVPMEYVTMIEAAGKKDPAKTLHNEHMKEKFNVSDDFLNILSKYKNDLSNPKVDVEIDKLVGEMSQALTTYEGKLFKDSKEMGGPAKSNSANKMINTYLLKGSAETSLALSGAGRGKTIADQFIEDYGVPILRRQLAKYEFRDLNVNGVRLKQRVDNAKDFAKVKENNLEVVKEASMLVQRSKTNSEITTELSKRDRAIRLANKIDKPIKKARVFDFDDTVARTNSKVFATKDGKRKVLTAEEFAKQGERLEAEGWKMDFSDFNKVVEGKKGPLFDLMKKMKDAAGERDMFILTARSPESAPAIKQFLDAMGINIPLKNITGLGNSSGKAKADWLVDKAAEGYNDFYFADDAPQNVKAVRDALEVLDVKSQTQQAVLQRSKTLNENFNKILEESIGIGKEKVFSDIKAEIRGAKKGRFKFWIPPSAEDFTGLLYKTLGKGRQGERHLEFYKENLLDPYSRAMENLSTDRVNLMADFKKLKKELDVPKDLRKQTESGFTNEQAVRVYLWNKTGQEVPGISKTDLKELNDIIENDAKLKAFADQILSITKGDGYSIPKKSWAVGTITTDLIEILNTTKRGKYLENWKQNVDIIFSKENMNKLEAAFGKKYREALENSLARMKAGRNRIEGGNRLSNRVLDYINNSTGAIMFFNTRSAILQTISAANFINWSFNNPLKAGQAFANQKQYWKDFTKLMNSEYLVDRRNGLKLNISESEIADAAKTSKNKAKAALNYILEKGYLPTKYADSFAIASGGATFYRNRIKDLMKKEGLSEAEAEKIAMQEFRRTSEISQQSSDPSKISQQQSTDLGRVVLQFVNTPMQYARIQKRAAQDIINGRGDNKTNVSKIIYYGFLQNMMFNALQSGLFALGFGDDGIDDEEEKKIIRSANGMTDSILRGLGFAGVTVQVLKNLGIDLYDRSKKDRPEYGDAWMKLLEFSPAIKSKVSKIKGAAYPFDSKKRRAEVFEKGFSLDNPAYESLAKVITATTNLPLDRLYSKVNNIKGAFEDDQEAWKSTAMILGWPEWQLETSKDRKQTLKDNPSTFESWEQKSILRQFGLSDNQIKKLKNKDLRTEKILQLQKNKNKQYFPQEKDKSDFYKSQGEKSSTTKKSNKSKSRSRSRVSRRRTR